MQAGQYGQSPWFVVSSSARISRATQQHAPEINNLKYSLTHASNQQSQVFFDAPL
jgi:hypothetical protein